MMTEMYERMFFKCAMIYIYRQKAETLPEKLSKPIPDIEIESTFDILEAEIFRKKSQKMTFRAHVFTKTSKKGGFKYFFEIFLSS